MVFHPQTAVMLRQPVFRWFHCNEHKFGSNENYDFNPGGYLKAGEPMLITTPCSENNTYTFFERSYSNSVWFSEINTLVLLAQKNIIQLQQAAINPDTTYHSNDYAQIRRQICELWLAIRSLSAQTKDPYKTTHNKLLPSLKNSLNYIKQLQKLPDYVLFHIVKQNENTCNDTSFHFLHLCLDFYWLSLTMNLDNVDGDATKKLERIEKQLEDLLTDLMKITIRKFQRFAKLSDLCKETPFLCPCFKELWLLIQLYVEQLQTKLSCKHFWHYFNNAAKTVFCLESSNDNEPEPTICMWLLYHVTCLQKYVPSGHYFSDHTTIVSNYELVEQCLKIAVSKNINQNDDELMCLFLHLLSLLQDNCWPKDVPFDILQSLWEYYYKQLNNPLSGNETEHFNKTKPYDFISQTNIILKRNLTTWFPNVSSYEMILGLLCKHLRLNLTYWPKLRGRIYSKLPVSKLVTFTDPGLQNLVQLFLVLAQAINLTELSNKLQSLLDQLPAGNIIVWSAYMALLLMRTERSLPLSGDGIEITTRITTFVHSFSNDRTKEDLIRMYVKCVQKIIDYDSILTCQTHVLFGDWISNYLLWCSYSDIGQFLEILIILIEKLRALKAGQEWWSMLENYIVPSIIKLSADADTSHQISELAAVLITADPTRYKILLDHMTGDSLHITFAIKFLKSYLNKNQNTLTEQIQIAVIQAWFRIAVLNMDRSELIELTQIVSNLRIWKQKIGSIDLQSSNDDPLYMVIRFTGNRVREAKTIVENSEMKRWIETYFGRMEQWIGPPERNAQQIGRIYTCTALLFLHCAPALYVRNKSTCLFYRLTSKLLLPSSVAMSVKPSHTIFSAIQRTWHLFARGMTQLDYHNDSYIERTLKDLIIKYVPFLYDASSPIIRCLDSEFELSTTEFVLDKISNTFLTCKLKHCHEYASQALKLVFNMIRVQCNSVDKFEIFLTIFLPTLFEQLLFIEHNEQVVLQIIECIKMKPCYNAYRHLFGSSLLTVIEKHLSFYSSQVFRLIETLLPIFPREITEFMVLLKNAVHKVERMRGVGHDRILRKGLQQIQELANQHNKE